jgi:CubicO group peptidase (beta-lactamase class C family)
MSVKNHSNCFKVSAALIFLLFFQFANAQKAPVIAVSIFPEIDKKLEDAKKELGGSVSAMIWKDGKVIYQKNIGVDFNTKTQVPIAHASQWLAAALVMTFVDQGKISLSDKVSTYLPIFAKYSKGYITIKDCLAHLTGIESEPIRLSNLFGRKKFASLQEEIEDYATKKEIESNPGLEFRYSNIGFNIAGRILEVITKRSFEQLMQERITRPMMMRNTSFSSFGAISPAAGGLSTAFDYTNFLSMILNKGVFNGKTILSEKAINDMQTIATTPAMIKYAPKAGEGYSYGFGEWIIEANENNIGTVLACPGLAGTWPMIDKCRGYSLVIVTKGDLSEEKRSLYLEIKEMIDAKIPKSCN